MKPYKANTRNDLPRIAEVLGLNGEEVKDMQAVSAVLPFKVNNYVLENLIDRNNLPNDPMYQLTVPQRGMLADADFQRMRDLVSREAPDAEIKLAAREIQARLNPHPAGQQELNKPMLDGEELPECSTSIMRRYCSSRRRAKPVTLTARIAFDGRSLSAIAS